MTVAMSRLSYPSSGVGTPFAMLQHIAHRLLISVPVLIGVLLVGFLLLQVDPTDPATVVAGPTATNAEIEEIREASCCSRPAAPGAAARARSRIRRFISSTALATGAKTVSSIANSLALLKATDTASVVSCFETAFARSSGDPFGKVIKRLLRSRRTT